MRVAVAIGATKLGSPWLADLLDSLRDCRWPIEVNVTANWELATIGWAAERFDEFIFLPESTVVTDPSFIDRCFTEHKGAGVNLGTAQGLKFRMYLGKYRAVAVNAIGVPVVHNKAEAIGREVDWCIKYANYERENGRLVSLGGPLEHTDVREFRHGRTNMVVANEYLVRYKGTWI